MVIPFIAFMFFISFNPELFIKNLSIDGQNIAKKLFLIMAILLPIQVLLQRISQSILVIGIKDYISLRIDTLFNLI